uniref:Clarin-3 n=1 Tax=Haemonchus contortus TaxID=6289 RepID=A0A7I4Z7D1_HAECO|nr:Tetratricopeptide repeat protein 4 [Haemonchus contortus]
MGAVFRKVTIFISLIFYLASLSFVICACMTDFWIVSEIFNESGPHIGSGRVNSGLINGMREMDWGLGTRYIPFSVFTEIQDGISFYDRVLWIFILFFIALGILWICVGMVTSLLSAFVAEEETVAGPIGMYLWSLLALLSLTAACIIFYIEFQTSMQKNLLTADQIQAGYSTQGQVKLGYSFYFMLGALLALYFPPLLVFVSSERRKQRNSPRTPSIDPTALLY